MSAYAAEVRARRPLLLRQFAVVSAVLFLGFAAATALLARQQAQDARNTAHDLVCHELWNLINIWQHNQSAGLFDALYSRPEGFRYEFLDGFSIAARETTQNARPIR